MLRRCLEGRDGISELQKENADGTKENNEEQGTSRGTARSKANTNKTTARSRQSGKTARSSKGSHKGSSKSGRGSKGGKYLSIPSEERERAIAYMESTVVDIAMRKHCS